MNWLEIIANNYKKQKEANRMKQLRDKGFPGWDASIDRLEHGGIVTDLTDERIFVTESEHDRVGSITGRPSENLEQRDDESPVFVGMQHTRAISPVFLNLSPGNLAAFVDQKEVIPNSRAMLVTFVSIKQAAGAGALQVALYLAPETMRNIAPIDPAKTTGVNPLDIQLDLMPIGNSSTEIPIATLIQGYSFTVRRHILIPSGWLMKALCLNSSATATAVKIYMDYFWTYTDENSLMEKGNPPTRSFGRYLGGAKPA